MEEFKLKFFFSVEVEVVEEGGEAICGVSDEGVAKAVFFDGDVFEGAEVGTELRDSGDVVADVAILFCSSRTIHGIDCCFGADFEVEGVGAEVGADFGE